MKKKSNSRKKQNKLIDMSYRKNINVELDKMYVNEEEFQALILELERQMEQMKEMEKKYYSANFSVDRIRERNFIDILKEKISTIIARRNINRHNAFIKEKSAKTLVQHLR